MLGLSKGIGLGGVHALIARTYSLLALLLLNPNDLRKELEERAEDMKKLDPLILASIGCQECSDKLNEFLNTLWKVKDNERLFDEFEIDYTNVLLSRPGGTLCPPYESIYVLGRKAQIGDPRISNSLNEFYSVAGLSVKEVPGVMPDYAPVELEFLAALHEYEFVALSENANDEAIKTLSEFRREFLFKHPKRWLGEFAECIINNSKNELLKGIGDLLICLMNCEEKL